jgi:methylthioribulose-1-phosphate dehydratase
VRAIDDPRSAHGDVFSTGRLTDEVLVAAGTELAAESARFAGLGWMPGTAGNLSVTLARDPLTLAVTASGFDKGELTPSAIVLVDGEGAWVGPDARAERLGLATKPSAEAGLHARIAALTGAGAVIHVHALTAVRAGHAWPEGVELQGLEMLKGIGHSAHDERVVIPVVQNQQDMRVLGDDFERVYLPATEAVREVPALIVANHGIYAWGSDLRQARWHLELTEALLQIALATR